MEILLYDFLPNIPELVVLGQQARFS